MARSPVGGALELLELEALTWAGAGAVGSEAERPPGPSSCPSEGAACGPPATGLVLGQGHTEAETLAPAATALLERSQLGRRHEP